jgi:hypothetical protein
MVAYRARVRGASNQRRRYAEPEVRPYAVLRGIAEVVGGPRDLPRDSRARGGWLGFRGPPGEHRNRALKAIPRGPGKPLFVLEKGGGATPPEVAIRPL